MHGVEATLAAADALDGRPGRRRPPAGCAPRPCGRRSAWCTAGPGSATGGCPSTSPPTGRRCPSYNRDRPADPFRPYGVTVGHQFEWSRLALHLRAATDDPPSWLLDDARDLFAAAARRGWAADGHDGFPYTLDWDDRPVVAARMHWVLCEASPRRPCWAR